MSRLLPVIVVLVSSVLSASSAWGAPFSAGRFVVQGKPLGSGARVSAGHSISVFAKPVAVTVDGCVTSKPSVRVKGGVVNVAARLVCTGIRGRVRLEATIRRGTMRGDLIGGKRTRAYVARLVAPKGTLLRGRTRASALGAIGNGDAITRHPGSEVSVSKGLRILRTELLIELSRTATIGQANAALAFVGGRIAGSFARSPLLTVAIPDPGSLAALDALRRLLVRRPGVAGAERSVMPRADDLPTGFPTPLQDLGALTLHQLLALRMPAAWNARTALDLSRRPLLLIEDFFGDGLPDTHVDAHLENPSAFLTAAPDEDAHGYHVLGIAAANHDSDGSSAGLVTGVFPATTDLDVVDLAGGVSDSDTLNMLRDEVLARSRIDPHIVINTSLGFGSGFPLVRQFAGQWLTFIRDNGLENSVLQATAAGNSSTGVPGNGVLASAWDESAWTAAALVPGIKDANGDRTSNLLNTLVVESVSDGGAPSFDSGCRSSYSDVGGTVSAYGDNVYSDFLGSQAGTLSGTSMATPEIAALAEYLWTIAPDLTASQVRHAIEVSFSTVLACQDQPAADAYDATLSLDHPGCFTKACAPARFAILDQNHDGRFDQADVSAFADHIFADPAKTDRDWSQYDLNGDGFTGGDTTTPFDLDTTGSTRAGVPTLGTVNQTVHDTSGNPVPLQFDEHHVSDADVLCYYAYSGFYTTAATSDQRDKILGDHCQPPVVVTACGTEGDSSTSASVGSVQQTGDKGPGPGGSPSSISIPQCSPPMNAVFPDNKSEVPTASGCGSNGLSACDSVATANGTMAASATLGPHGGTIQMSAQGDVSGQVSFSNGDNGVASANVSADSGISFKVNRPCQYTASGNITISQNGGGTVSSQRMALNGPSGALLTVTSGPGSATGTLQPGSYGLGGSANINGNTAPPILSFTASADVTGSINLAC